MYKNIIERIVMAKKKIKKSELEKVQEKVRKQLDKLEALHEKEEEVINTISEIVELDDG
jgi:paraquat-inducible protein B